MLVVYCAKHPAHKFTTVVGWYKHATVFRHYQEAVFAPDDIQYYNVIANSSDCVLLPAGIRSRKVQWEVPRKSNGWAYGFGRAIIARRHDIVYGKFFDKKAGFISKKWLPVFANYRRDGYDFALCTSCHRG